MNLNNPFLKLLLLLLWYIFISILLMPESVLAQKPKFTIVKNAFIFDTAVFRSFHASTIVQLANGKLMMPGLVEQMKVVRMYASIHLYKATMAGCSRSNQQMAYSRMVNSLLVG